MNESPITVALAGNPNVGKSTIFNGLTGMHQHTANWAGVTVSAAEGSYSYMEQEYRLIDLPGIYSLSCHSDEERVSESFLSSGKAQVIAVVCDATCLERGLRLLKQILGLETVKDQGVPLVLCVNLCDEASCRGISIDFALLEDVLQIPVVPCCAHKAASLDDVKAAIASAAKRTFSYDCLDYSPKKLAAETAVYSRGHFRPLETRLDRIFTGPVTGVCVLLLLLFFLFWLTMAGANYPSQLLWDALFGLEKHLAAGLVTLAAPEWLISCLVYGVYRVLAWVISVMLPPMAIFFPLFTLLEDLGYLPRAAFLMDRGFARCRSCGKQCLTMAMGLGCNAAGVTGCRIMDSPRERLIGILTNAFIPCNGRFPTLFTLITLFFAAGAAKTAASSVTSALCLTAAILTAVFSTLFFSWLLSVTVLKGIPSSFTLELPPYRRPQIRKVLVRSVLDRTLCVLGRAAAVAAPAGLVIWLMANVCWMGPHAGWFALRSSAAEAAAAGETLAAAVPALTAAGQEAVSSAPSLLSLIAGFLEPLGQLMGLDGIILTAFLLGFPANEIVLPIILMAYLQTGTLTDMSDLTALKTILVSHGWTWQTALSMIVFSLFHWPCSTTVLTIKKETGSLKWTALSILLPTAWGVLLCIMLHGCLRWL